MIENLTVEQFDKLVEEIIKEEVDSMEESKLDPMQCMVMGMHTAVILAKLKKKLFESEDK